VAGVFVGLTVFFIGVPLFLIGLAANAARPPAVPAAAVLELDLRGGLSDQDNSSALDLFRGRSRSVLGIDQVLRQAGRDARVKGLLIRLPEGPIAPGEADELREAIRRFRADGKPVVAHSQGLYAEGTIASTYEVGAASGEIWMQPGSSFQVTGLAHDDLFFKRFFDKYGVKADFQQRGQYKTAVNGFLYDDYTPAHRESELSWMSSVLNTAVVNAAQDRHRDARALVGVMAAGPYLAEDARTKGLIDQVGQVRDAEDAILGKAGWGARFIRFEDYAAQTPSLESRPPRGGGGPAVAVIEAEGDIMTGASRNAATPIGGGRTIYSDDIAKAFYDAIDDHDVKAIVFRVNSPGGSDTASEQILSALRAAKAAGKPVVVSMGTYAASGGYWISSQANEIVAQPSTLTGSIGVFGGKFAIGPALGRFGIDERDLKVGGDYADANSSGAPMTPAQRAAASAWMDRIYGGFIDRVAQGRKMTPEKVRGMAEGRVWTGAQAKALGLVDHIGGFYDAVERAKALAGIQGLARLQAFGAETSPLDQIRRMFGQAGAGVRILGVAAGLAEAPQARSVIGAAQEARLRSEGADVLMAEPFS
jgi:protease-4